MDNSMSNMSASSTTGETGRPMDQVREQTGEMVEKGKEMAGKAVEQARTQIKSQLSTQKDQLAGSIDGIASALRTTGNQLQDNQQANLSPFVDRAAEMIEGFSGYLREHDLEDLVVDVETMARRNPSVFLGAAFAMGFVMARFFKSSSTEAYETQTYRGGRSIHPEDVHRGYEESEYRTRRMNRRYESSYDRPQAETGWSTGTTPVSTGSMPSAMPGTLSPARETPTMTQPAVNDRYTADLDEADEGVAYTRNIQE